MNCLWFFVCNFRIISLSIQRSAFTSLHFQNGMRNTFVGKLFNWKVPVLVFNTRMQSVCAADVRSVRSLRKRLTSFLLLLTFCWLTTASAAATVCCWTDEIAFYCRFYALQQRDRKWCGILCNFTRPESMFWD